MNWHVVYTDAALKDLRKIKEPTRSQVLKAIAKVSTNPGAEGYGKPLGNRSGNDLAGLFKIKLRSAGIRVVYQLIIQDNEMKVIVVGVRSDKEVYRSAARRINKDKT